MNKITKLTIALLAIFTATVLTSAKAFAICPVCTIAIGAGLGLSRWLGVDDVISGIWIGGLLVSTSLWTVNWLRSKKLTLNF